MQALNQSDFKNLYFPDSNSHKGQNGKLMLISGSQLFYAASVWPLTVASRIVDMVYYASVTQNNEIIQKAKQEFRNGIVVPRNRMDDYILEADCILIGPGLPRETGQEIGDDDTKKLTEHLLTKYPDKQWVIDGGSLQVIDPKFIPKNAILTPHPKEFEKLFGNGMVFEMAKKYDCIIVLKGEKDIVCNKAKCVEIAGGNSGMTKGGTGDVLAGLIGALACKNDPFLASCAGSFINKKAADYLFEKQGIFFNSSDLVAAIPIVMKHLFS